MQIAETKRLPGPIGLFYRPRLSASLDKIYSKPGENKPRCIFIYRAVNRTFNDTNWMFTPISTYVYYLCGAGFEIIPKPLLAD